MATGAILMNSACKLPGFATRTADRRKRDMWRAGHPLVRRLDLSIAWALFLLPIPLSTGCSHLRHKPDGAYTTMLQKPLEDAEQAKELNTKALSELRKGNYEQAELLFKQALEADVNYAPAHNNLGQVYLHFKQLYLAAWEFEFAINLMPDRPEPYLNLGLVFETAGRLKDAEEQYLVAQELSPNESQVIGCLARVSVKLDDNPEHTALLLEQVVMHAESGVWADWARGLLETKFRSFRNNDEWEIGNDVQPLPIQQSDAGNRSSMPNFQSSHGNEEIRRNLPQLPINSDPEWIPAVEQPAPVKSAIETSLSDP